jgi:hypothetical protein
MPPSSLVSIALSFGVEAVTSLPSPSLLPLLDEMVELLVICGEGDAVEVGFFLSDFGVPPKKLIILCRFFSSSFFFLVASS